MNMRELSESLRVCFDHGQETEGYLCPSVIFIVALVLCVPQIIYWYRKHKAEQMSRAANTLPTSFVNSISIIRLIVTVTVTLIVARFLMMSNLTAIPVKRRPENEIPTYGRPMTPPSTEMQRFKLNGGSTGDPTSVEMAKHNLQRNKDAFTVYEKTRPRSSGKNIFSKEKITPPNKLEEVYNREPGSYI